MKRGSILPLALAATVVAMVVAAPGGAAAARRVAAHPVLVTITIPARHADIDPKWLPYKGAPRANVLLPAGYDPRRRYPLIVALNGLNTDYSWWADWKLTDPLVPLHAIIVMPEGASGWYTDWWNHGERGGPSWETYELDDVLPTILRRYPILPQRRYHALIGTSMGGMGAAYLGGRLPGFFGSVASLSGFVDPQYYAPVPDAFMGATSLAPVNGNYRLFPVEGRPYGFYMRGHNPTRLAANLRQSRVFVSTGNGAPSTHAGFNTPGSEEEGVAIYPMSQRYHRALVAAGVDVTWQPHTGGHDIPDFLAEVEALARWGLFKPVVTHPRSWVNDTVATHGQLWDVGYRFARPPTSVVRFRRTGDRLSISSAGSGVTLTLVGGCSIHTRTPATVSIPPRSLGCYG
ncbi:MAG TPA: alpha/beta hydrolase-fold protein [Mycobacteriales bacterium]|nr:alpha/beta hydrolase-fold protein [Mycobacteriales bacterium]